jgi:O-antigen ligase
MSMAKYYPRALALAAVILFFANLSLYLFTKEVIPFPPLFWIIGFAVAAAPMCFSRGSLGLLWQAPMTYWCYGFLLISGAWLLCQPSQSEGVWQEFRTRILSALFLLMLLCVFSRADAQALARRAILVAVMGAVAVNVYEIFNPSTFSSVVGRSAGLYVNPTQAGAALVLGMILSVGLLPQRLRLLFALAVGLGIFLTFSRAAMIGWFVTMLVIIWTGQINLRRSIIIGCTVLSVAGAALFWQWDKLQYKLEDSGALNSNVLTRVRWFNDFESRDFSVTEREEVAHLAWQMFADNPILGHGVGTSTNWDFEISSHNQYLNLMVDHGILGLFIFPCLVLATVWRAEGEARKIACAFSAFIFQWGFFSHNILEERYILLSFSLLGAMALGARIHHKQQFDQRPERPLGHEDRSYNHCPAR